MKYNKKAIIFIGIPASGKSSFYFENFQDCVHINLDSLHTRNKERLLMEECFQNNLSFVVDNTNPTRGDRAVYINKSKDYGYKIIGYYFQSSINECLERNQGREGKARISDVGVKSVHSKLELPSYSEGFDELFYVQIQENKFIVKKWSEE